MVKQLYKFQVSIFDQTTCFGHYQAVINQFDGQYREKKSTVCEKDMCSVYRNNETKVWSMVPKLALFIQRSTVFSNSTYAHEVTQHITMTNR